MKAGCGEYTTQNQVDLGRAREYMWITFCVCLTAVSYTHLDVYKRQVPYDDRCDLHNNI